MPVASTIGELWLRLLTSHNGAQRLSPIPFLPLSLTRRRSHNWLSQDGNAAYVWIY